MSTKFITKSALIAAVYVALTLILQPISYGPIQFRLSEILTLLPVIMVEGIWGVTIGCLIANIVSAYGIYDIVFGSLATLIAALITYKLKRNIILAGLPPVIINALVVPLIFLLSGGEAAEAGYLFNVMTIFISEAVVIFVLGIPTTLALKKVLPLSNNK